MSNKAKIRKAQRDERQKKQAQLVIKWICGALILFTIIFYVVYLIAQN